MRKRKPEELKVSGIEWIGKIPNNWGLKKLKFVSIPQTSNVDKKSKKNQIAVELCNYTDVYYNEFIKNDIEFMKATATNDQIEKFKLEVCDVIITKDSESPDDIAVPALVKESKQNLICGYHLAQIKPNTNKIIGEYLFRLFQSDLYSEEFGNRANGITRYGLGTYELKNIDVVLPPKPEQRAIATFLDRKTQAIDRLIEKKQQLIEKLKEKRQALITQAVTKGLNPGAPMKDSGIEWLGEIPEHWEVKKLKHISNPRTSNVDKKSKDDQVAVELCNYTDVYYNEFISNDIEFMKATATNDQIEKFQLELGDVIITKDSESPDDIAVPALVKETKDNLICGYHLAQIRPKAYHIKGEYLFRLFQSNLYREEFGNRSSGITRYGLGTNDLKNVEIILPPVSEQIEITNHINNFCNKTANIIEREEKLNLKLKEYRQSLISAAVTGKIDVRDEVKETVIQEAL